MINHSNFSFLIATPTKPGKHQNSLYKMHADVLQNHNSSAIYDAVEDAFVSCGYDLKVTFIFVLVWN